MGKTTNIKIWTWRNKNIEKKQQKRTCTPEQQFFWVVMWKICKENLLIYNGWYVCHWHTVHTQKKTFF